MNGKSYKIGTTSRDIYIREQVSKSGVDMQAVGSNIFYLINPSDQTVRTAEATEASSSADNTLKTYTVADGSVYREKEVVEIQSTGDVHKGMCQITDITGNVLTLKTTTDAFTFVTGDKLLITADPMIPDGYSKELSTTAITKIRVKSEFTTSSVNLIVTVFDNHLKKKN